MKLNFVSTFKKVFKSETPDPSQCAAPVYFGTTSPTSMVCNHHYQPQPHHPLQTYQHQQPMHVSTCPFQQPQHIIQSHQLTYSNTLDSRSADTGLVLNSPCQLTAPSVITLPPYQNNQIQTATSNQSPRCQDNLYYNQAATLPFPQQHQHQFQSQVQHHYQIQHLEEPRQKQQQQLFEQQTKQQHILQQQQQQQQQLQQQQHILQQQQKQLHQNQLQNQPQHLEAHHRLDQLDQQQYQNHPVFNKSTNGDEELSLETLCICYDESRGDLLNLAETLRKDLSKLSKNLDVIREETPVYSVSEVKL